MYVILLQCNNHLYVLVAVEIIAICNRIHILYCYDFCHFIHTQAHTCTHACKSARSIQYELLFPFNTNKIHWELFVCNHVCANREQTLVYTAQAVNGLHFKAKLLVQQEHHCTTHSCNNTFCYQYISVYSHCTPVATLVGWLVGRLAFWLVTAALLGFGAALDSTTAAHFHLCRCCVAQFPTPAVLQQ